MGWIIKSVFSTISLLEYFNLIPLKKGKQVQPTVTKRFKEAVTVLP